MDLRDSQFNWICRGIDTHDFLLIEFVQTPDLRESRFIRIALAIDFVLYCQHRLDGKKVI